MIYIKKKTVNKSLEMSSKRKEQLLIALTNAYIRLFREYYCMNATTGSRDELLNIRQTYIKKNVAVGTIYSYMR
jgi:hypothetical protein